MSTKSKYVPNFGDEKMDIPCNACSMFSYCKETAHECSAFKSWVSYGEYDLKKVAQKLKPIKIYPKNSVTL